MTAADSRPAICGLTTGGSDGDGSKGTHSSVIVKLARRNVSETKRKSIHDTAAQAVRQAHIRQSHSSPGKSFLRWQLTVPPVSCVDSEPEKVKPRHDDLGVGREPLRQPLPGMLELKSDLKAVELRDP